MLQSNSRIETENSIKFYEQDFLLDDYIYSGDLDLKLDLEYITPGFGIALVSSEGYSLSDKEEVLLFRIGFKESSVIYKNKNEQKTLGTFNCGPATTYNPSLSINLIKSNNNKYTLYVDNKKMYELNVPYEFNSYNLAYYSSGNNAINNINIACAIPYDWNVNMSNTKFGYINFIKDGFTLEKCQGEAEIEQMKIKLSVGTYHLKFVSEGEGNDIKPFVSIYNDNNFFDEEKNMLNQVTKTFKVTSPGLYNLKFKGTTGTIKKIQITDIKSSEYIKTSPDKGDFVDINGSYMDVRLESLSKITWTGTINDVTGHDHMQPTEYAIISDGNRNYGLYDLNVSMKLEYDYEYNVNNKYLVIKHDDRTVYKEQISTAKYLLTVFKNVNAKITKFKLYTKDGETIDTIVQDTIKKYVPSQIKSPIIITNKNNMPLNLSSSYRRCKNNYGYKYVFTNVEREYFNPKHVIKLTNLPSKKSGVVIAYGIKKEATVNMDKILDTNNLDNVYSLDEFCNLYDIIFEKDMRSIDKEIGEIRFSEIDQYQLIVVDYLKRDSYAINYKHELNTYEVDISIEKGDEANALYDNTEKSIEKSNKLMINSKEYIQTNIIPSQNCYIVLGR